MGYVSNFYGIDLSARSIKRQNDKSSSVQEETVNEEVNVRSQVKPEQKAVAVSALDVMANIARGEINTRGKQDNEITADEVESPESVNRDGQSYDELVLLYYNMANNNATDEELIPILREIIDKWTPDATSMFGETRNLWQSTLAFRINRAYFADTLNYLENGGDTNSVDFDEIASFEKDLAETYKVPMDKFYEQNRKSVYGALINLYSIMLFKPGLSEEDKLKLEAKLEDVRNKLAQFE